MTPDQRQILDILAQHTGRPASCITPDAALEEIGLDSLKFILVILDIEQGLKRKMVDIARVGQLKTVHDLLALSGPAG